MSSSCLPLAAVVFDFDGVLADTERLHLSAFRQAFAPHAWTIDESVYFARYLGCDDRGLIVMYAEEHGLTLSDEMVWTLLEAKTHAFDAGLGSGSVLFPQARACIDRLTARYSLGIASGAAKAEIVKILEGAGLRSRFSAIVAADDVSRTKPHPEPYLRAAEQLGADPRACLAIEDSPPGLQAARAAGMRTIGITNTVPRSQLSQAHIVVDSLDELTMEMIERLGTLST
jgi:HAD superfamily hydrolase (TIGR01509 family)